MLTSQERLFILVSFYCAAQQSRNRKEFARKGAKKKLNSREFVIAAFSLRLCAFAPLRANSVRRKLRIRTQPAGNDFF
jgi:hypothetical protein